MNIVDKPLILIVDDNPRNIQFLAGLLSNNNYEISFAQSGEAALEFAEKNRIDLILLDVMMPGMDGYEVCRQLKACDTTQYIPVIFLTAKVEPEDIVKGFEAGGADYVSKPFNAPELLARVKVHIEMKVLKGLIPICAKCKSIRNEKGLWDRLEVYIEQHSDCLFTHGLCSKCTEAMLNELDWQG